MAKSGVNRLKQNRDADGDRSENEEPNETMAHERREEKAEGKPAKKAKTSSYRTQKVSVSNLP